MSKRGENIYKRKDGRWEARYAKGCKPDGSVRFGYCYAASYREVRSKLAAAKAAMLHGETTATAGTKRRFGAYCEEWLLLCRSRVKESTYMKYDAILRNHVLPQLGACPLSALSTVAVEQFSHTLLTDAGLSAKTVRCILAVVQAVIGYIRRQDARLLPQNIEIVYPKSGRREMRVLSREEQQVFTAYLLDEPDDCKFGALLALWTGLRLGEVCALRWGDISLADRTLTVSSTMLRLKNYDEDAPHKTKIVLSDPKSTTSARVIPLPDCAVKLCAARHKSDPAAFVLTGERDRFLEPRTLQYRVKRYAADCGLADVHFHVLRHTFATRCIEVGFEIKSLSEILGHTSPEFTLERYVHSSLALKRDNMEKFSALGY